MTLGQWLNSLSSMDHLILLLLYIGSIYLSNITLNAMIDYYNEKKQFNKFRIKFRVSPIALLSLGFLYSFFIYKIFDAMFEIMP